MVQSRDIDNLLQTGSWTTGRSKSRARSGSRHESSPVRANQSTRLDQVPRSLRRPVNYDRRRFPPSPSVEDEEVSLAKEYNGGSGLFSDSAPSDEEPKCRGELDQTPIILEVHEYNPERRFVILDKGLDGGNEGFGGRGGDHDYHRAYDGRNTPPSVDGKNEYQANTCRKYVLLKKPGDNDSDSRAGDWEGHGGQEGDFHHPGLERKKSHQDLPKIDTELRRQPSSSSNTAEKRRHRPSVTVEQQSYRPSDHKDHLEDYRTGDGLLSPVVQHSTNGRDRAYWDYSSGSGTTLRRSGSTREKERHGTSRTGSAERRSTYSTRSPSATPHKRGSTTDAPRRDREHHSSERDERRPSDRDKYLERSSSIKKSSSSPQTRLDRKTSLHKSERRHSPSPHYSSSKESLPTRSSSYRRSHHAPAHEEDHYWSDDHKIHRPERHSSRNRRSTVEYPRGSYSTIPNLSPEATTGRPRSRITTPQASPGLAQVDEYIVPDLSGTSPRSSTFPVEKHTKRYDDLPPYPSDRSPSATSHAGSHFSTSMPIPIPIPIPTSFSKGNSSLSPKKKSSLAPSSYSRHGSSVDSAGVPPPRATTSSFKHTSFDSDQHHFNLGDKQITSYRQYSEGVRQGLLPQLPECRRITPQAGLTDWLTIPGAENFTICPSCYESVFAHTRFQREFFPVNTRRAASTDEPRVCTFGSSPWHQIAYLMTLKNNAHDLRLLVNVATVAARHQACAGTRIASRVWYSLLDPYTRRPIGSFTVCHGCARTVEALLPSLAGSFVPLDDPAEPSRGLCELRYGPERKRFVQYFDLLETAADSIAQSNGSGSGSGAGLGLAAGSFGSSYGGSFSAGGSVPTGLLGRTFSSPDLRALTDRVREISLVDECRRAVPVADRKWRVMDSLPEFTVCEECFDEVVWPYLEAEGGRSSASAASASSAAAAGGSNAVTIPRRFSHRTQARPLAACQLYSDRMREVFRNACRRNDFEYLEDKVKERVAKEERMHAKLSKLHEESRGLNDPWAQEEVNRVLLEWKSWE